MATIAEQLREEGRRAGMANFLTRLLIRRFGSLPETYLQRIKQADTEEELLKWAEQLLVAQTIEAVFH